MAKEKAKKKRSNKYEEKFSTGDLTFDEILKKTTETPPPAKKDSTPPKN